MKNLGRNTAAVLVITLFTGLAVFSAVQLGGRLFGTQEASAQTAAAPASVQTESEDGYGNGNGYGQSESDAYGYDQGSDGSSGTMTCPATGCSASSCHALE
jgi:hypothetical protein